MKVVGGRHFCLLFLAALAAACSCTRNAPTAAPVSAPAPDSNAIRVRVVRVAFDESAQAHYVLLRDASGLRVLPIMVEDTQARAIELAMKGIKPERPLTHDLMRELIDQTGNKIDYVEISDLRDEVYYAKISMNHGHEQLDSRPSDAIALAMGSGAPIYVANKLLQTSTTAELESESGMPPTLKALGVTVQDLTPELATYFDVDMHSGVLVSDVSNPAKGAGLERGDLITEVDSIKVTTLHNFGNALVNATATRSGPITLTVERDGATRAVQIPNHSQ
ncbi:MAG TPA: bifunctional nuclease domain-containing protein [Candidatus Binataceae bacterium]|nr:bifunctional nuclease domain-containing protein [Candidatus Binataceae bacterium]